MYPKPVQTPHPPIHVGGESDAALRRVAQHGQGWYSFNRKPEDLDEPLARLDELLAAEGRSPGRHPAHRVPLPAAAWTTAPSRRYREQGVDRLVVLCLAFDRRHARRASSTCWPPTSSNRPAASAVGAGAAADRRHRHPPRAARRRRRRAHRRPRRGVPPRSWATGSPDPRPTAVIEVDGRASVGWVDHDHDDAHTWLDADECNVGYHVFAAHRGRGHRHPSRATPPRAAATTPTRRRSSSTRERPSLRARPSAHRARRLERRRSTQVSSRQCVRLLREGGVQREVLAVRDDVGRRFGFTFASNQACRPPRSPTPRRRATRRSGSATRVGDEALGGLEPASALDHPP